MKQRIVKKKLKKDVLIQLWIKQWNISSGVLVNLITWKDKELRKNVSKINNWLFNYELYQIIKLSTRKHPIKLKQVWKYLELE